MNLWAKRLRDAKTLDELNVLQFAYEMEERADRINLSLNERNKLCHLLGRTI